MSNIEAFASLTGTLSSNGSLSGKVSASGNHEHYDGEYVVVPDAYNTQILTTANKMLTRNLVVKKVPYYETSNVEQGVTVYIAGEEG